MGVRYCSGKKAILKDCTKQELLKYQPGEQCKASTWAEALSNVLKEMEDDRELFTRLLRSYPSRLAGVKKHHGQASKYWQTDFKDFGCFVIMFLVEIVCFQSNFSHLG